jgi:hypothetical protein
MEASPSLPLTGANVHLVLVPKPAGTRSTSSCVNSRAALRINTLFWSLILFSFHHFGSNRAQNGQKTWQQEERPLKLGFTQETISIPAIRTEGDEESVETSTDALDFLRIQLTSALTS